MIDPMVAYQVAVASYKVGKFTYKEADKRVAAYAEREGGTKAEAWILVRQEAARRGDHALVEAADYAGRHPIGTHAVASAIPGGTIVLAAAHVRKWIRTRSKQ